MTTVHYVYSFRPRTSTPDAIGNKVAERLSDRYRVIGHDLFSTVNIRPEPGDVLLGHPWYQPWSIFNRSLRNPGWRRRLILMPYQHSDIAAGAFVDPLVARCDQYLAITGRYWFEGAGQSIYGHWTPKMVHMDLAVDRQDFPVIPRRFNPPGKRKFLYIGHAQPYKDPTFLSAIALAMPEAEIAWIGGTAGMPGVKGLGHRNLGTPENRELVGQYDFLLTVGTGDANPTTILEAMAWGLVPVCTPQSGYVRYPGIPNVPSRDVPGAVSILRGLQQTPEQNLLEMQAANWRALDEHFNWDRFSAQVIDAIESDERPAMGHESLSRKLHLKWITATSPRSYMRPRSLYGSMRRAWRKSDPAPLEFAPIQREPAR